MAHDAGLSCVGEEYEAVWAAACRSCGVIELEVFEPRGDGTQTPGGACWRCGGATLRCGGLLFEGARYLYTGSGVMPEVEVCACLALTLRADGAQGLAFGASAGFVHLRGHPVSARSRGGICQLQVASAEDLGPDEVPGLIVHQGWLDEDEQAALLTAVDVAPWSDVLARRVQHYGWRYDYKRRSISEEDYLGPLPGWAELVAQRLLDEWLMPTKPSQLIVNEYLPGQGIAAHVDAPSFGPVIGSISLGSAAVMRLRYEGRALDYSLPPGSLLTLAGPARHLWTHEIAKRKTDPAPGGRVARGRRVSLTLRTVGRRSSPSALR